MTIDEFVINLAREAGLGTSLTHNGGEPRVWIEGADWHDELTRFAALVRAEDEALLRQTLEALSRAHQTAMYQTLKARLPECAEFAGIAQDLDFVVAALRERLGEGAEP